MAQKPTAGQAADDQGQAGTDQFKTYQDEKGLTGADADKTSASQSSDDPGKDPLKPSKLAHGEKSPAQVKDEESEQEQSLATLGLPAQSLPENQDPSVDPSAEQK